jgi:hypothetical protein
VSRSPQIFIALITPAEEEKAIKAAPGARFYQASFDWDSNEDVDPNAEVVTEVETERSSCFEGVGYDPLYERLYLSFRSGDTYRYNDVPLLVLMELLSAESMGEYFHRNIRMRYVATHVV